jgi:phosphoribosylaminoimidazolecarboxamide formyltransferase/IMP cyclohydrolase
MPKAILSVYDKTGLVDFASGLNSLGWTLLASGGTAKLLRENQIPVTEVADYTGSPEILGGRVKTLHPAIHGGLLARQTEGDMTDLLRQGWNYIDLAAVNLYLGRDSGEAWRDGRRGSREHRYRRVTLIAPRKNHAA